uniref:Zn(2)-C6 fungal-type domain-containing protein n=1 Tax=Mycena chlorophos TaxID=658473 RepID=A0ABQ0M156_MYCCL|nr:predicted protein [Mycena chlorophos]
MEPNACRLCAERGFKCVYEPLQHKSAVSTWGHLAPKIQLAGREDIVPTRSAPPQSGSLPARNFLGWNEYLEGFETPAWSAGQQYAWRYAINQLELQAWTDVVNHDSVDDNVVQCGDFESHHLGQLGQAYTSGGNEDPPGIRAINRSDGRRYLSSSTQIQSKGLEDILAAELMSLGIGHTDFIAYPPHRMHRL